MVEFRFFLFSLIAVFLALGTGVLVGGAISGGEALGEKQRVMISNLERDYRAMRERERSLTGRVVALEGRVRLGDAFAASALPFLIDGRLSGKAVAVVATRSDGYARELVRVLEGAGARPVAHVALPDPEAAAGSSAAPGEALVAEVAAALGRSPDAVAVLAYPGDEAARLERLLRPAVAAWRARGVTVVAGEALATAPSLVPLFRRLGVSSVDNADEVAGRAALVFLLAGSRGDFGVKETARSLLPAPAPAGGGAP